MDVQPIPADARLVQIALGRAVFGVAVADGRVVAAAPIARRILGRAWRDVASGYQSRGARFREVPAPGTPGHRALR